MVQFIIEGYEEMATVSTMDPHIAIIRISIIPDFVQEMNGLMEYLKIQYNMKELDDYRTAPER